VLIEVRQNSLRGITPHTRYQNKLTKTLARLIANADCAR